MSKQSEAKEKQQYVDKFEPSVCGNCASMTSEKTTIKHAFGSYEKESKMRCKIGGFKIKKMGSCSEWSGKPEVESPNDPSSATAAGKERGS